MEASLTTYGAGKTQEELNFAQRTRHKRWMRSEFDPGLVSVIIPTFNRATLIGETIKSVIEQTYRPIEIVVVDDGSKDETETLIKSLSQNLASDVPIRYFRQENSGACAARNLGLIESTGEYIQFLDSDDLLHPNKLEFQVRLLREQQDVGYVYSRMGHFVDTHEWAPSTGEIFERINRDYLFASFSLLTMVGIYRRSTVIRVGPWNESLVLGDDLEYHVRMLCVLTEVAYLNAELCSCREHLGQRLTTQSAASARSRAGIDLCHHLATVCRDKGCEHIAANSLSIFYFSTILQAAAHGNIESARRGASQCSQLPLSFTRRGKLLFIQMLIQLPRQMAMSICRRLLGLSE